MELVGDDNGELDVVVTTLADGVRQVASLAQPESGIQMAAGSSIGGGGISDDGRFVLYSSQADDLVSQDSNRSTDAFHFDRLERTNRLVSVGFDGLAAGGVSAAALARNGHRSAVVQSGAGHTAGDGLPDGWERDQFGTLAQDGGGDSDGDGMTNAQEFFARAIPTDGASNLRVVWVGGNALEWTGHAGVNYLVERREGLGGTETWAPVGGLLAGHEGGMRAPLDGASPGGFYRVSVW